MLKFVYSLFIGGLVVLLIGVGIEAFYPSPKYPEYPNEAYPMRTETTPQTPEGQKKLDEQNAEYQKKQELYENESKKYRDTLEGYNRRVSLVTLGLAIGALTVSLLLSKQLMVIADGLLLGSLFTLIYSIGRGMFTGNTRFQFFVIAVGLIISLAVGYYKFIFPVDTQKK